MIKTVCFLNIFALDEVERNTVISPTVHMLRTLYLLMLEKREEKVVK